MREREGAGAAAAGGGGGAPPAGAVVPEALNDRAVAVIRRINAKLAGRDFAEGDPIARLMSGGIGLPSYALAAADSTSAAGGGAAVLDVQAQVRAEPSPWSVSSAPSKCTPTSRRSTG
jgi:hypothetical protein